MDAVISPVAPAFDRGELDYQSGAHVTNLRSFDGSSSALLSGNSKDATAKDARLQRTDADADSSSLIDDILVNLLIFEFIFVRNNQTCLKIDSSIRVITKSPNPTKLELYRAYKTNLQPKGQDTYFTLPNGSYRIVSLPVPSWD